MEKNKKRKKKDHGTKEKSVKEKISIYPGTKTLKRLPFVKSLVICMC